MSNTQLNKKRKERIRTKLSRVSADKPRLTVHRTNCHIYAQLIDDLNSVTLASASTAEKEIRGSIKNGGNKEAANIIGKAIAQRALKAGVSTIVFDRSGYLYHGRVKALADAARENGLIF